MNINFGLPQFILVGLTCMSGGINLAKHGEPKEEKYNFWVWALAMGIEMGLLIWGGFFS